jgi:hypothetical protein
MFLATFFVMVANAETYYVRTDGSNSNDGLTNSAEGAWLTVTYAESQISRGDIVIVQSGTYDEGVTINIANSGSDYITFVGEGETKPVIRKFTISGVSYVKIINFEITHNDNDFNGAIEATGTTSYVQILDCYIHHVRGRNSAGEGAVISASGTPTYWTIRGNEFYYLGFIPGVFDSYNTAVIYSQYGSSGASHWLVEYNEVHRVTDVFYMYGENHIVRNNYVYDSDPSYWSDSSAHHIDFSQSWSDGVSGNTRHHIYEANLYADTAFNDAHLLLLQDTYKDGDTDVLIRGNVLSSHGGGGTGGTSPPDDVHMFHNSFYDTNNIYSGAIYVQYGTASTGNEFSNNCISTDGGSDRINIQTGSCTTANNLGHKVGSEPSYVSTSDPLYINPGSPNWDLTLGANSPAINAGKTLVTITSATGSGTSFTVDEPLYFTDGKGIAEGDVVTVGSTTTRITDITGSTVVVADSVSWAQEDGIYWNKDTSPDIGAYPFRANGYSISGTYTNNSGTITVTPNDSDLVRFVEVYEDNVPIGIDYSSPYTVSGAGDGQLSVRMYPRYASRILFVEATSSGSPMLAIPYNLRILY